LRTLLHAADSQDGSQADRQQRVLDSVASSEFKGSRTMRIISTRITGGAHFRDGLVQAITKAMGTTAPLDEDNKRAIERFKTLFPQSLQRGTTIDFVWLEGNGVLGVAVDGKEIGRVDSGPLAQALFRTYLGKDSRATAARANWISALATQEQKNLIDSPKGEGKGCE